MFLTLILIAEKLFYITHMGYQKRIVACLKVVNAQ